MSLKYIVFRDLDSVAADPHFAIVFMQELRHAEVASMLRESNPTFFSTAVGAGFITYDTPTKKFRSWGDASSLNLVSQETDAQYVNQALLTKGSPEAFMITGRDGGWYWLFAAAGIVPHEHLSQRPIYGRGLLAHHLHKPDHPFKIKLEVSKGAQIDPSYLEYCELAMAA